MNEEDYKIVDAMQKYGGSFVRRLGTLARYADPENLKKIKETWPAYWEAYKHFD